MIAGFGHAGPLTPVEVPEALWAQHPLLSLVRVGDDGVVDWQWPDPGHWVQARRIETLQKIGFVRDEDGGQVARIPPRLNHDWFIDETTDEQRPAPMIGRVHDHERFYELEYQAAIHYGFVAARTDDAGVRHYFEWIHGIWVNVPRSRWLSIRDGEAPIERDDTWMREHDPVAYAAPRFVRSTHGPLMSRIDGMVQSARAESIASIAHRAQSDKLGAAYIDHPARVADAFDCGDEPIEHAAAWLHDVLEDTDLTADDLLDSGILPEVVEVVAVLTRPGFPLDDADYYERVRGNPWALRVKAADLDDNSAPWRVRRLDEQTRARLNTKYRKARAALGLDENEPEAETDAHEAKAVPLEELEHASAAHDQAAETAAPEH